MSEFRKSTTQAEVFRRKLSGRRVAATRPIEEKIETLVKFKR